MIRGVNKPKNYLLSTLIILAILISTRQAFGEVGIIGSWVTGTSHTKVLGPDRLFVVIVHAEFSWYGGAGTSSVTYGGQMMTKISDITQSGDYATRAYVGAFVLDDADIAAASNDTISVTWVGTPFSSSLTSVFLQDVDQTVPITDYATAGVTDAATVSTYALSTIDGDMVIAGATCTEPGTYTPNNGFIEAVEGPLSGADSCDDYKAATGAYETPSVTHSTSTNRQALIGFVVHGAIIDPDIATHPSPPSGASGVPVSTDLSWDPPMAYTPTSYDVYLGTNPTAHSNPKHTVYTNSYNPPGNLDGETTYYWAVDCNDNGTIYPGFPWSFTTSIPVNIDLNTTHQTIRGFGGISFNRWGHGLQNDAQVDTAFGNGPGQIGMTILRIDIPPDSGYWDFEVDTAKRAIDNHGAIVFASPWSPPAWMKTNGSTVGGELKTDCYDDYADHLTDFANHMSSNGAPLYAISLQNEPDISVGYESCDWTSTQMRNFLINNASVIPTRVIVAESFNFNHSFTDPILNDPCAEAQADIIGGHIYGGGLYDYPLARSKGKEVWMTEHYTESAHDADLWPLALYVGKEIHDCMAANMNAYIWWYIRRYYGPMGESGNITKRGYCMSHFAKFVRPGYTRVDATANPSSGVYVTAYKSGDTAVIVAVNQNSSSRDVTFSPSGGIVSSYTKYETSSSNNISNQGSVGSTNTLAGNSISTFVGTISCIPGDLDCDGKVDFIDLAILGQGWLDTYDYETLADLADHWLFGI